MPIIMEEETQEQNEQRLQTEVNSVVVLMRQKWPTAADFNVNDAEEVEILDADDNIIAKTTTEQLTDYYNAA